MYCIFTTADYRASYNRLYNLEIVVNNNRLKLDPYPKLLGIMFDPNLSFKKHFKNIIQKAYPKLNILKRLQQKMKNNHKFNLIIYKILIRSIFDYSDLIINAASDPTTNILQKFQNKCLRLCLSTSLFTSTLSLHKLANMETIIDRAAILSKKYIARANISNPLITTLINEYKNASDIHEGSNIKGRKPVSTLLKKIIGI